MAKILFCTACGFEGKPKSVTPGSFLIELALWFVLLIMSIFISFLILIPGIIYSLWRLSNRHQVCSNCGNKTIIPSDSPIAVQQKKNLHEIK